MSDSEEQTAIPAKNAPSSSVGALLRATRTRMGQDLKQVSQALRIRQLFLQAIEDGRYDELPGPTYALGFVRSYSDFLGLDSEEVVRRFRAETTGASQKELVFPTPAAEKRLPSGAIVAAALALGVLVYGGWYAVSSSHRPAAEAVPEVPDRLVKPEDANKDEAPTETRTPPEEAKLSEKAPDPVKIPESKTPEPPPSPPKADAAPKVEAAPVAEAPKKPEPSRIEPAKPAAPALPSSSPTQGMGGLAISAQTAKPPAPSTLATTSTPAPTAGAGESAPAPADEAQRAPKVYGQTDGDVRLVIKSSSDSWIQVRDEKGNLVATRLLKKGDSYRVPTGLGKLSLTTGDAGALSASVDGVLITPSLGPSGSVRRDIALDPDRIKPGNQ